jgi:hypothetical protein
MLEWETSKIRTKGLLNFIKSGITTVTIEVVGSLPIKK